MAIRQIALRLAHRKLGVGVNDRGAAFSLREHNGVRFCRYDRIEIGVGQAGLQAVDAHDQIRPRGSRGGLLEKRRRALPRARLAVESNRIFEVNDQSVGTARHALVELLGTVGGNEKERAH